MKNNHLMKRTKKLAAYLLVVCAICIVVFVSIGVISEQTLSNSDSSLFTFEESADGTLILTGYSGSEPDVLIPSRVNGRKVTSIWKNAFVYNETLTSVILPKSIISIGPDSFYHCSSLREINLPVTTTARMI